jgi:hypothetical protein
LFKSGCIDFEFAFRKPYDPTWFAYEVMRDPKYPKALFRTDGEIPATSLF